MKIICKRAFVTPDGKHFNPGKVVSDDIAKAYPENVKIVHTKADVQVQEVSKSDVQEKAPEPKEEETPKVTKKKTTKKKSAKK